MICCSAFIAVRIARPPAEQAPPSNRRGPPVVLHVAPWCWPIERTADDMLCMGLEQDTLPLAPRPAEPLPPTDAEYKWYLSEGSRHFANGAVCGTLVRSLAGRRAAWPRPAPPARFPPPWVRQTRTSFLQFLDATRFPAVERHGQRGKTCTYPEWLILLMAVLAVKGTAQSYLGLHRMTCRFWNERCGRQGRLPPISARHWRER
jgi:hypothetical protein